MSDDCACCSTQTICAVFIALLVLWRAYATYRARRPLSHFPGRVVLITGPSCGVPFESHARDASTRAKISAIRLLTREIYSLLGASSGIGREMARQLAALGARKGGVRENEARGRRFTVSP